MMASSDLHRTQLRPSSSFSTDDECHQLLLSIKSTVEGLLASRTSNVWNTYGGLQRLCSDVEKMLNHRLQISQGICDFWHFVIALRWLQPSLAPSFSHAEKQGTSNVQLLGQQWLFQSLYSLTLSSKLKVLLQDQDHVAACYQEGAFLRDPEYADSLLTCLRAVEQNRPVLLAELNPSLLTKRKTRKKSHDLATSSSCSCFSSPFLNENGPIACYDPLLNQVCDTVQTKRELKKSISCDLSIVRSMESQQRKRRKLKKRRRGKSACEGDGKTKCGVGVLPDSEANIKRENLGSHPIAEMPSEVIAVPTGIRVDFNVSCDNLNGSIVDNDFRPFENESDNDSDFKSCNEDFIEFISNNDGLVSESGDISTGCVSVNPTQNNDGSSESTEAASTAISIPSTKKSQHSRSRSDVINNEKISKILLIDEVDGVSLPNSLPSSLPVKQRRKSLLEGGGSSIAQKTECYFPRPLVGQSLTSFLSSHDFHTCAELDRENAHFSISEALIAAIEQIKCNQTMTAKRIAREEELIDESDEEVNKLKQRIRLRRRERIFEESKKSRALMLLSDGRTKSDSTTTNASPYSSSSTGLDDDLGDTSDDVDELEYSDDEKNQSKLSSLSETGLSLSMASLYSDADVQRMQSAVASSAIEVNKSLINVGENSTPSAFSAESVALSLLKRFSEKQLPKASDLEWLVSEQDAPQQLLPLPNSWPVSPDECFEEQKATRLRGNRDWAPPRAQIIFNVHPPPNRSESMAKQNYRCAGCGMKTEQGYIKRFRYCEYLGKYFCQCCHNNTESVVPGKILGKWDFHKYKISTFSSDLMDKMWCDPLFNVHDINPALYKKSRQLESTRDVRQQLNLVKDFINTCRFCHDLKAELSLYPQYFISDPHQYSLSDLIQVKNGELLPKLRQLVNRCIDHVMNDCQLCQAKGFICEYCKCYDIIFPFQVNRVARCKNCFSCYHKLCFVPEKCPKCTRIEARRKRESYD
ncbi:KIAA0226 (predicted) [Pycnogonum litorale]